ncbi:MAG: Na+/H+ antiporter [Ignavibacteria bacterium]|nr:Na+/H+ antiporter [Ignavibacteria bacterium]
MVQEYLFIIIGLLFLVLIFVMIGQRLKISYPIFLVIAGLIISLTPGIPHISIDPEMIFLIFLPPILYEAAWYTSWQEFWKWRRPISLLAFGLVFFTSTVVAFVSESLIPGFTLALGFLLGGIISPPDAVAATSVLKGLKIPKRAITILEGESLVNDASSLIVVKFALAAVVTGQFVLQKAIGSFFIVAGMGIVVGLFAALIIYSIHKFFITTPSVDTALTLLSPYIMYVGAEYFHFSGVMAVVSGGLYLSYRSHKILNYQSRLQAIGVWSTLIFLINGTVFILIGLEMPSVIEGMTETMIMDGLKYGILISFLIIAIRFLWTYIAAFLPRILFKKIRESENNPGWKSPFLVSFAAMRGVVSLAAALYIPLLLPSGAEFPMRNTIIFITVIVIFITLVGQGLALPWIIRLIKVEEIDDIIPEEEQEAGIQLRLKKAAMQKLNEVIEKDPRAAENQLVVIMKTQLENQISFTTEKLDSLECDRSEIIALKEYHQILKDLIHVQRNELDKLRSEKLYTDEVLRKQSSQLDLDEARISD